jgi:DNA repair protein RadC
VLRTGDRRRDAWDLSRRLLDRCGGLTGLVREVAATLQTQPGLGPAKAASLVAAIELGRRALGAPLEPGQPISSALDVQRYFQPRLREVRREAFHVLLLDGRHRLIALENVSVGTLTASLVHPREVFREAIRRAAAAMLLVHNHPSGDPRPSAEDRDVTCRLRAAGELLGIRVLDHVIVAEEGYFSFREMDPGFSDAGRLEALPSPPGLRP